MNFNYTRVTIFYWHYIWFFFIWVFSSDRGKNCNGSRCVCVCASVVVFCTSSAHVSWVSTDCRNVRNSHLNRETMTTTTTSSDVASTKLNKPNTAQQQRRQQQQQQQQDREISKREREQGKSAPLGWISESERDLDTVKERERNVEMLLRGF